VDGRVVLDTTRFSRIFLLGILIFKWLTARHLLKSFGVKRIMSEVETAEQDNFCGSTAVTVGRDSLLTAQISTEIVT
jgi:hypothetical protein